MSPTFEDFAKTGVHLRLHMDASFKLKPLCEDNIHYFVIHMYIGNVLYPFVHVYTNNKSQYVYDAVFKYMEHCIPNLNVELFISNDQSSIEAAYNVFPKAVRSYYEPEDKENKKENLNDLELYHKDLKRIVIQPKRSIWTFIEMLKEIDYSKMCYFLKLQDKKIPARTPKMTQDAETQADFKKKILKAHAFTQTKESACLQDFFPSLPFVPKINSTPKTEVLRLQNNLSSNKFAIKINPSLNSSTLLKHVQIKKSPTPKLSSVVKSKPKPKPLKLHNVKKLSDIRSILENFKDDIQKKFETKPISIKKLDETQNESTKNINNEQLQLEVLIDPNDFANEEKVPSKIGTAAVEALKVLNALKKESSSKPTKRPVIILNPKSLVNNEQMHTTKIIKITKTKPVKRLVNKADSTISKCSVKSLVTLCSEVLMPDHNYI